MCLRTQEIEKTSDAGVAAHLHPSKGTGRANRLYTKARASLRQLDTRRSPFWKESVRARWTVRFQGRGEASVRLLKPQVSRLQLSFCISVGVFLHRFETCTCHRLRTASAAS